MTIALLIREYPGETAWAHFAAAWVREDKAPALLPGVDDAETAAVVRAMFGAQSEAWIRAAIPALGGHSVVEIIRTEPKGRTAIRHLLMRLP